MPRKLTESVKWKRMLKKIMNTKVDYSKFTLPTIIILKNNESIYPHKREKLRIYKSRNPFHILPLVKSGLKLYRLKKYDKITLDKNISKNTEEVKTIPKGLNVICRNRNQIKLIGVGAMGSWIDIPKSNKGFKTMYSRTGKKTMAEYMVKNKIKTNYKQKSKVYGKKIDTFK